MRDKFRKKKQKEKEAALEMIKDLFAEAEKRPKLAAKYVSIARKIATRTKTKIPLMLKRRFCKHCGNYLKLGLNARIRLNKGKKTVFCMNCGKFTRIPYK